MRRQVITLGISVLFMVFFAWCDVAQAAQPRSLLSLKGASYGWTVLTNPVESFTRYWARQGTAAEEQHVVPQRYKALSSHDMVVYWIRSNHSVTDRVGRKPFLSDPDASWLRRNFILSLLTLGNDRSQRNLDIAYRMGAYGRPYSVLFHNYNQDGSRMLPVELDGPSILMYGVSWLVNIPQKLLHQIAYYTRPDSNLSIFAVLDILIAPLVILLEGCFCVVFTILGFVIGCILNPISSLTSIGGAVWYLVPILWTAIWELVVAVFYIILNVFSFSGAIRTLIVLVLCGGFWLGGLKNATS